LTAGTYRNPVLPGFHPDPSIVRVGVDYYMVNSTFQFFPAIVISHSRDLVHWRYIGHGINCSDYVQLRGLPDSFGFWAPDISFYEGTYYMMATLRLHGTGRENIIVTASAPEGPYSEPVVLNETGLDPSHFVDDDGTHYMVYGGGGAWIHRLSDDCLRTVGEPSLLWAGTGRASPEGPHLLKKDGYYYVILAEGGTEYGHCITVARSRTLFGEYEPCPFNPVHTQTDPAAAIQRAGHGKLVQTQNGEWWIVHLAGRPLAGGFCTLGRETCLEPVQWTADGWFTVNDGRGPSDVQRLPQLPAAPYREPARDDFDGAALPLHWSFARNPVEPNWSLAERPGWVRLRTADAALDSIDAENVLVRRERHHRYSASLRLEFAPERDGEEAGLVCYYDSRCFVSLALAWSCVGAGNGDDGAGRRIVRLTENRARTVTVLNEVDCRAAGVASGPLYLKVEVNGIRRAFYFSGDNTNWQLIGNVEDASFLSDEGTREKKAFTGTMVGFYATAGGSGRRIAADFDWFEYVGSEIE
jgi:xylan 1,4-beta-xylosidase